MNWYLKVLKQYVDFGGRARRTEFWMFTLFNVIISIALAVVDALLFGSGSFAAVSGGVSASVNLGLLGTIYSLAVLLPSLAVTVRRLHDTDRSGWWILIGLVPLVGGIVLLVFMVLEGTRGPNSHGPDPKAVAAPAY
jgi:uncharacterized membrane protein YhaH (DUF805 family)